ncbi:MAG: PQQ-binding-like beta-propeller repeat protein [Opitutaceae bacterium]
MLSKSLLLSFATLAASAFAPVQAADWPHVMGPTIDRKTPETVRAWTAGQPRKIWQIPTSGGFSSWITGAGRAYTMHTVDGLETVIAVDRKTGKPLWETRLGPAQYRNGGERGAPGNEGGDGPRSTPVFAGGRIFVFGGNFDLHALDAATGKTIWTHDLLREFGGQQIEWSNAASPLVLADRVLVAGGGRGQSFLAFRPDNGEPLWKSGSDRPTHSTPIVATIHGQSQALFLVARGLVSLDPQTGRELWHYPFPHRTSTAASPVVWRDIVNCTAAYGVGGAACQIKRTGDTWDATELWRRPGAETAMHWSTAVVHEGFLYGHFGHRDFALNPVKCVDIRTGKIHWEKRGFGPGQIILAGDRLIATSDAGELVMIEATPSAYKELARADVIEGKVWASPALSDGQIFLRSTTHGVCLEL